MNNEDRRQWVDNDESLYDWFKSTRLIMAQFVKQNRKVLDEYINHALGRGSCDE